LILQFAGSDNLEDELNGSSAAFMEKHERINMDLKKLHGIIDFLAIKKHFDKITPNK
jgi:hypothetical protein